jgi:imidazolonepropionase-like amidohydrolase
MPCSSRVSLVLPAGLLALTAVLATALAPAGPPATGVATPATGAGAHPHAPGPAGCGGCTDAGDDAVGCPKELLAFAMPGLDGGIFGAFPTGAAITAVARSAVASASASATPLPAPPVMVVHCGTLLDVPGGTPRTEATIVVAGGRIEQVLDGFADPATVAGDRGFELVDLSDHFVLPGLIDCHTHITGQYDGTRQNAGVTRTDADAAIAATVYARRTLMAGFTTIRNVGSSGDAAFAMRDAIRAGQLPGPRILVAGESISPLGGHSDGTLGYRDDVFAMPGAMEGIADGVAECRKAVRAQVKRGADVIKLTATGGVLSNTAAGVEQQFFADELEAIMDTGHLLGRRVAAHAHGATGIKAALRAGVDSIEHGTYLDDECIDLFRQTWAFLVPTIHAGKFVEAKAAIDGFFPEAVRDKAAAVGPLIQDAFGRAYRGGVRIAFGTDVGVGAHGTNAEEFVYMVEAGMPAAAAIHSATVNAAELCDLSDEIGTLEAGKAADIIAVAGDPTRDVARLQDVRFVMKGGTVFKRDGTPVIDVLP